MEKEGAGRAVAVAPVAPIRSRQEEFEAVQQELAQRSQSIQKQYDGETLRIQETRSSSITTMPRRIERKGDAEAHSSWQRDELQRIAKEFEETKVKEAQYAEARMKSLHEKWAEIAEQAEEERVKQLKEELLQKFDQNNIELLQNRHRYLEEAYVKQGKEVERLKQEIRDLNVKELSTFGNWIYRSAPADNSSDLQDFVNQLQPAPRDLMGCVSLPMVHIWVRDTGQPKGITYTLIRDRWHTENVCRLVSSGSAVILGASSSGEIFYFRVDNPIVLKAQGTGQLLSLSRYSPGAKADEDVSGMPVGEEDLKSLFNTFDTDSNGTIGATEFVDFYRSLDVFTLSHSDRNIDGLLGKHGVMMDGKMTFDEFALIMLQLARQ